MSHTLPLFPELIPAPCFGYNLRSYLKPDEWKSISRYVRARANGKCEVCSHPATDLEAHELWSFDDIRHVQNLQTVKAICPLCHRAFHIGQTMSQNNPYLLEQVYDHMKKVNGINDEQLQRIIATARMKWNKRSKHDWQIEVDDELLAELLEKGREYR